MTRILACGPWNGARAAALEEVRRRGCEVELCGEGAGPLECVVRRAPDILLYSVQTGGPWESGMLGLIRRVHPALPLVMVTADGSVEERLRLDAAHPDYVAVDPIEADELCDAIGALLERRRAAVRHRA